MAPNADRVLKRRALPLDQTVRWLPLHDAYYLRAEVMTSARALPLVVMQEALLQVEMHASSEVYGSTCGVLCGAHYRDPGSGAGYILVEGIERATRVYRDADPEASLAVDISRAIDAAERAGRTVVGWYRFDVALFPRLPVADAGMHRALFPEPWQVALLRDGADGEGSGVFMRVEPTEGRAFPIPFFELIPKKRARPRSEANERTVAQLQCRVGGGSTSDGGLQESGAASREALEDERRPRFRPSRRHLLASGGTALGHEAGAPVVSAQAGGAGSDGRRRAATEGRASAASRRVLDAS